LKVAERIGKDDFNKLMNSPGRHLIVFAAKWCGFCSRFIDQAQSFETSKDVLLSVVDTDDPDESLWDEFSIRIVPTLAVFDNGKIIFRRDGKSGIGLRMSDLEEGISKTIDS